MGLLSDEELAGLLPAETHAFAGPIPTQSVSSDEFVPALVGFNVGVEAGQLAVIALAFAAVALFRRKAWYRQLVVVPASCLIAAVGLWWAVERIFL